MSTCSSIQKFPLHVKSASVYSSSAETGCANNLDLHSSCLPYEAYLHIIEMVLLRWRGILKLFLYIREYVRSGHVRREVSPVHVCYFVVLHSLL